MSDKITMDFVKNKLKENGYELLNENDYNQ